MTPRTEIDCDELKTCVQLTEMIRARAFGNTR